MRPHQLALPSRQTFLHHSCRRITPQSGFRVAHLCTTVVLSTDGNNRTLTLRLLATRSEGGAGPAGSIAVWAKLARKSAYTPAEIATATCEQDGSSISTLPIL